ncbi:hypothetical protein JG688_00008118 [Phytophthora aleatoria]|uniref:RxLR effector protein n=1 Tax=Phytophthora aleatoria TaxID=2496075 RepID=A0A8J5M476_9STRA|nr:hypothetical protein JG688_00008118 [Phytophthora aleatoria]
MRLHHVLLVTAATLLASASALLATDEIKGSRLGHLKVTGTSESLRGYSTYKMWKDVGLEKITTREQLKTIQNTQKFKLYKRYAIEFDEHIITMFGCAYTWPTWFIDREAAAAESTREQRFGRKKGGMTRM